MHLTLQKSKRKYCTESTKINGIYVAKIANNIFDSKTKAKRFLEELRILRLLASNQFIIKLMDIVTPSKPKSLMDTLTRSLLPQQRITFAIDEIHTATQRFESFDSAAQRYQFATQRLTAVTSCGAKIDSLRRKTNNHCASQQFAF